MLADLSRSLLIGLRLLFLRPVTVAERLRATMDRASNAVWERARDRSTSLRVAAYAIALERVCAATDSRGF